MTVLCLAPRIILDTQILSKEWMYALGYMFLPQFSKSLIFFFIIVHVVIIQYRNRIAFSSLLPRTWGQTCASIKGCSYMMRKQGEDNELFYFPILWIYPLFNSEVSSGLWARNWVFTTSIIWISFRSGYMHYWKGRDNFLSLSFIIEFKSLKA